MKELVDQTTVEGKQAAFECLISRDDGKVAWFAGDKPVSTQVCEKTIYCFSSVACF